MVWDQLSCIGDTYIRRLGKELNYKGFAPANVP
jgi:hypothetical protein